jgi:PAS domain S-box-containing protein
MFEHSRSPRIRLSTLVVCAIVCLLPAAARAQQPSPKRVLVLYWYNKDYPWNVKFDQRFQGTLRANSSTKIEYFSEYLESNRFPGENQTRFFRDYLKQKYADRSIDIVVATSDASLDFLLNNRADLFPRSPIVFIASRSPSAKDLSLEPGLTGILNLSAHERTAELARQLHPGTQHIYVISGTVEHDKRLEILARENLRNATKGVDVTYLTDLALSDLIATVKNLPEHSIVLYVWQQSQNARGITLESSDIFASIAQSASAPFYVMTLPLIGSGAVGGYVNTAEDSGTQAASIVLRIANGARASDISIAPAPATPMFDWRQLQRWKISESRLPPGSIVEHRELTFWHQYRLRIIAAITIFLVQAALIAWLLWERRSRRQAEDARRHLAAIVESSNDAIIGTTLDGQILSWNEGAESLYGYAAAEVLDRNVSLLVPADRSDEFADTRKLWSQGERVENLETIRLTKDGGRVDVSVSISPIKDDRGRAIAVATITRDISDRKLAQRESQELAARLIRLQEEERRRIAAELHDSLGQSLVIIKNRAMICLRDASALERVTEQLEEISNTATSAIDEVHEIAHNLRPYELDRLGLVKAIEEMVSKAANSSTVEFSTDLDHIEGMLSPADETSVYRIIQEGLNNVIKHAQATRGTVSVKRNSDELVIYVSDNGKGIKKLAAELNGHGFGLAGVAERARMLGGSSAVESMNPSGTKIMVTLPLPKVAVGVP